MHMCYPPANAQLLPDVPPQPCLSPGTLPQLGLGFEKTVGLIDDDSELSEATLGTLQIHFSNPMSHPEIPKLGGTATQVNGDTRPSTLPDSGWCSRPTPGQSGRETNCLSTCVLCCL